MANALAQLKRVPTPVWAVVGAIGAFTLASKARKDPGDQPFVDELPAEPDLGGPDTVASYPTFGTGGRGSLMGGSGGSATLEDLAATGGTPGATTAPFVLPKPGAGAKCMLAAPYADLQNQWQAANVAGDQAKMAQLTPQLAGFKPCPPPPSFPYPVAGAHCLNLNQYEKLMADWRAAVAAWNDPARIAALTTQLGSSKPCHGNRPIVLPTTDPTGPILRPPGTPRPKPRPRPQPAPTPPAAPTQTPTAQLLQGSVP